MPIRGQRSIYPATPPQESGIFRSPQKQDDTSRFDHQSSQTYAHSTSHRSKPKSSQGAGLRHQPPRRK